MSNCTLRVSLQSQALEEAQARWVLTMRTSSKFMARSKTKTKQKNGKIKMVANRTLMMEQSMRVIQKVTVVLRSFKITTSRTGKKT